MSRSNSTLLIVLLMIFTFPIWMGIFGALFGVAAGLFGAVIGIIGGIFGAIFGTIFGVIGSIFSFDWYPFPFFHFPGFRFVFIVAIIFLIVLLSRSKKRAN